MAPAGYCYGENMSTIICGDYGRHSIVYVWCFLLLEEEGTISEVMDALSPTSIKAPSSSFLTFILTSIYNHARSFSVSKSRDHQSETPSIHLICTLNSIPPSNSLKSTFRSRQRRRYEIFLCNRRHSSWPHWYRQCLGSRLEWDWDHCHYHHWHLYQ